MTMRTPFDELSKKYEKAYSRKRIKREEMDRIEQWMNKWRELGPIEFADKVLIIDPRTGERLVLSEEQKEFLIDMWKNGIRFAIIAAGRGAGKTFVIAVYVTWRICTHKFFNISCMGGSSDQSKIVQRYITGWRINNPELDPIIMKDIKGEVMSIARSSVFFLSCSGTSTRGEHTREFIVDEEAEGERSGGGEFIDAALFQVSTSKNIRIIRSSTAHYIQGEYYRVWRDAEELGYKRYRWSLAKHISGETDPYKIYTDRNKTNWMSNVPWTTDETIQLFRKQKGDEKWLVEILGGISIGSGLVYKPEDINLAVCEKCKEIPEREGQCFPYREGYCVLPQVIMELCGVPVESIPISTLKCMQHIIERIMGIDYGYGSAADAWTVFGRFKEYIFVLFSEELVGLTDKEKMDRISEIAKYWYVAIMRPDPAGYPYNNELANRGFAIHELDVANEKGAYVHASKKFIERHLILIPMAYENVVKGLKGASYDKNGKIRKGDDHTFDSFIYGVSYYDEIVSGEAFDWSKLGGVNPFHSAKPTVTTEQLQKEKKESP